MFFDNQQMLVVFLIKLTKILDSSLGEWCMLGLSKQMEVAYAGQRCGEVDRLVNQGYTLV